MQKIMRKIGISIILLFIVAIYFILAKSSILEHLSDPSKIKELILLAGYLAPIILITLQAFQAMISIFPSQLTTIAAGFIFGPFLGLVYSLIGAILGSSLVFFLSRKYGKKIMVLFFDKKEMSHFTAMFQKHGDAALLMARVIPLFPNDLASIAAGLTTMKFPAFLFYSSIGFFVQMIILTLFGSQLSALTLSIPLIVSGIIIIVLAIVVIFREKLKIYIIRDVRSIEKEVKKFRKS